MEITNFEDLKRRLEGRKPLRLVVVAAREAAVSAAVRAAARAGWVHPLPIIAGKLDPVTALDPMTAPDPTMDDAGAENGDTALHTATLQEAAELGAEMIRRGEADIIMKGGLPTADFLRPLLAKERNLVAPGKLLSHCGVFVLPGKKRLTLVSDGGLAVHPDLAAKEIIIENAAEAARILGYLPPKVAVLSAVETVNPKIPSTVEADALKQLGRDGRFGQTQVSGPYALDNALCPEAVITKGMAADPVAGAADVLIVPDLVSGNILLKSFSLIAGFPAAGVVLGAKMPIILTSRADKPETKLNSIAMACYLAAHR